MNRILKKFLQRGVDLSPVGVELREDNTTSVSFVDLERWISLSAP